MISGSVASHSLRLPRTVASLSMEFPGEEHWGGLPFHSPGDLPDPGIKLRSPALHMDSLPLFQLESHLTD